MRLKYDTQKPFTKEVTYQNYFKPTAEVTVPKAYVIPQGWHDVIELLDINQVKMERLEKDSIITIEAYEIDSYETRKNPYEGHYPHYDTNVTAQPKSLEFRKGDVIVKTNQEAIRYLMETLEPQAPDSFFNWNFFDTVLQQKEGFSPYVWEDKAKELLDSNDSLMTAFETKKQSDQQFSENWYAQLDWLHKNSRNYETAHMQYPIYRIVDYIK